MGRVSILPVMVSPHDSELEPGTVRCLLKTLLELFVIELCPFVPIPINHPCIDPMAGSQINFLLGPRRIGFVVVAPQRPSRHLMAAEQRPRVTQQLKLSPA